MVSGTVKEAMNPKQAKSACASAGGYRAIVCISSAFVRTEPKESTPIGKLNYGDRITITGEKNGFCQMGNGLWVRPYAIRKSPK